MKKFIRKHSVGHRTNRVSVWGNLIILSQPPDMMESGHQAPVSILKKPRVTEAVNTSVRKSVIISERSEDAEDAELRSNVSEPDSEDSALCLQTGDTDTDTMQSQGSVGDRERRKWVEKAVPLSNNPYSKENIVRRKSSSSGGDFVSMRYNIQ